MATVLFAWELGGGMGHLGRIRPLADELIKRGHRVVAALRELSAVYEIFAGSSIAHIPAPIIPLRGKPIFDPPYGYAHLLANIGFADRFALDTLFCSWNNIVDCVMPDLVVADHCPTALLALRGRSIPKVNVGLGFFCPPDGFPLPSWSTRNDVTQIPQVIADEMQLTESVNQLLESKKRPRLMRLSQIFSDTDEVFLATYPEFDHFGPRANSRYWGHWTYEQGIVPRWPAGTGPKIYAYLKPFPALEHILQLLSKSAFPSIVLIRGMDRSLQRRYASSTLHFKDHALDLNLVAQQCDFAILHAGHGATAPMLLAGKPCLLFPQHVEQALFAQKVEQMGAGRLVPTFSETTVTAEFQRFLTATKYRTSALAFAKRYESRIPGEQIPQIVNRWEALMRRSRL